MKTKVKTKDTRVICRTPARSPAAATATTPGESFLTPIELRQRWKDKVSLSGLAKGRMQGPEHSPRFIKVFRKVLYPLSAVEEFERNHMRSSTSDEALAEQDA